FGERRARPRAYRPPPVVIDGSVSEHLEVLRMAIAARVRLVKGVREADPVHRGLPHAADLGGWLDAQQFEHCRHHVDDVRVLRTDLTPGFETLRPRDDERIG